MSATYPGIMQKVVTLVNKVVNMVGANGSTAGSAGLVPAPTATDNTKFLKGDGTWATPTDTNTVTTATTNGSGNAVTAITATNGALTVTKGTTFLTEHQDISGKANLLSPVFTGTPTAPTATTGTNTQQIATTAFVQTEIGSKIAAADALIYKGTVGTGGTVTTLPNTTAKTGWTYKALDNTITVNGKTCEAGDMVICLTDGSAETAATWTVVQNNVDTMGGADGTTAGSAGLVPAPAAGYNTYFLRGDGTWAAVSSDSATVALQNRVAALEARVPHYYTLTYNTDNSAFVYNSTDDYYTVTLPSSGSYICGKSLVTVFVEGANLDPNFYDEIGTDGTTSTTIKIKMPLAANDKVFICVF